MGTKSEFKILLVLFILIVSSCKNNQTQEQTDTKIQVKTYSVSEKEMAFPIHSSGKLSLKEEIKLSFKTGGIIKIMHVDEGQEVRKGDILAELNLEEITASVKQAQLALEKAERDHKRVNNLYYDSVATLEQKQNAGTAVDFARSNLNIAEFNNKYSKIEAPENGIILKRLATKNEIIGPGYPVFLFASTKNDWIVRVNITDKDILKIQFNDTADITFDAYPGKIFKANVSEIGKAADPYTGTYEVELKLNNNNFKLISGLVASADIFPSQKEKLIEIPFIAMVEGNEDEAYIYILNNNNEVQKIRLKVVGISSKSFYVKEGIKVGMRVITDGAAYIKPESEIEVVN